MDINNFLSRIAKSRYNATIHGNLIRQLNIFQDLYKTRSIKHTAINLSMSPSSITRQIQKLEYAIGTALIYRHGCKGISITPEGEEVNKYAFKILDTIKEMSENALLNKTNTIKISAHPLALPVYVLPAIAKLKETEPEMSIEILMLDKADAVSALLRKKIDIIFYPFEAEKVNIFNNNEYNVYVGKEYETCLYMHKDHKLANKDVASYTMQDMTYANMMPRNSKTGFEVFTKIFSYENNHIYTASFDLNLLYYGLKHNLWSVGVGKEFASLFDCSNFEIKEYKAMKFFSTIFHWHIVNINKDNINKLMELLESSIKF